MPTNVSSSWLAPHVAALEKRREEERLAERLAARLRERAACEAPSPAQDQEPAPTGS